MTARDGFGLALRIAGLIVAIYGADWLGRFALGQMGFFSLERTDIRYYLAEGLVYLFVGAYFMRGASHFVRYAYGDPETEEASDDKQPNDIRDI